MTAYADSSFVVSLYLPDGHSREAAARTREEPAPLVISSLVVLETTNAMQLRIFRGERTQRQVSESLLAFESDMASGVLRVMPVPPSVWRVARRLSAQRSAGLGTRSLDILQVALALVLRADRFLTFDRNQAVLAQAEGLQTPLGL